MGYGSQIYHYRITFTYRLISFQHILYLTQKVQLSRSSLMAVPGKVMPLLIYELVFCFISPVTESDTRQIMRPSPLTLFTTHLQRIGGLGSKKRGIGLIHTGVRSNVIPILIGSKRENVHFPFVIRHYTHDMTVILNLLFFGEVESRHI